MLQQHIHTLMPAAHCLDEATNHLIVLSFHECVCIFKSQLCLQMLHVHAEGSSHPEHFDSINGITPAMRNARQRHFNNVDIPFAAVTAVEDDLLQIVQVRLLLPGQSVFLHHTYREALPLSDALYLECTILSIFSQTAALACKAMMTAVHHNLWCANHCVSAHSWPRFVLAAFCTCQTHADSPAAFILLCQPSSDRSTTELASGTALAFSCSQAAACSSGLGAHCSPDHC